METLQAIRTRRSIREYKNKPVSRELLLEIVQAGMCAPSAGDQQPWRFVVITDRKLLGKIPEAHPHAHMAASAAAAILVCGDTALEKYQGFFPQDCAAATQNILLAAHDRGLGAVWCGIYSVDDPAPQAFRKLFGLPETVVPFALVPIGYPDEPPYDKDNYKEDRITWR